MFGIFSSLSQKSEWVPFFILFLLPKANCRGDDVHPFTQGDLSDVRKKKTKLTISLSLRSYTQIWSWTIFLLTRRTTSVSSTSASLFTMVAIHLSLSSLFLSHAHLLSLSPIPSLSSLFLHLSHLSLSLSHTHTHTPSLSTIGQQTKYFDGFTPFYVAPELEDVKVRPTFATDVWWFGNVTIFQDVFWRSVIQCGYCLLCDDDGDFSFSRRGSESEEIPHLRPKIMRKTFSDSLSLIHPLLSYNLTYIHSFTLTTHTLSSSLSRVPVFLSLSPILLFSPTNTLLSLFSPHRRQGFDCAPSQSLPRKSAVVCWVGSIEILQRG